MTALIEPALREKGGVGTRTGRIDVDVDFFGGIIRELKNRLGTLLRCGVDFDIIDDLESEV